MPRRPIERTNYPTLRSDFEWEAPHVTLWSEDLCSKIESGYCQQQEQWQNTPSLDRRRFKPEIASLYKYRAFDAVHPERTQAILVEGKLWSPSLEQLNDPLEAAFTSQDEFRAESAVAGYLRTPWCGCISFSIDPVDPLMWSHYAGGHTGFCVKYRRADSLLLSSDNCRYVLYRSAAPDADASTPKKIEELIDHAFWTKSENWEYEREWRLRYPRTNGYTKRGLLVPHGVIFGLKTEESTKDFIRRCAPQLRYGTVEPTDQAYRLRVRWETPEPESLKPKNPGPSPIPGEKMQAVLYALRDVAGMFLTENDTFDPFGAVFVGGGLQVIIVDASDLPFGRGNRANQISRRVEDSIRRYLAAGGVQIAAMVEDTYRRPIEGGRVDTAIHGRIEEAAGQALTFCLQYNRDVTPLVFGEQELTATKPHFFR